MRINNLHISGLSRGRARQLTESDLARVEGALPTPIDVSQHIPSAELTSWIAQAAQEPEVRSKIVERVALLLVSGEYLTWEYAVRTAEAILNVQE